MSKQEARLLLLFAGFMMDSVLSYFLPFSYTKNNLMCVPCIGMMFFIFLNHYMNRQDRIVYSIGVGLYFAIIYAHSLLIYVIIYGVIGFAGAKYERLSSFSFTETLLFILAMFIGKEIVIFMMMKITGITFLSLATYLTCRLVPSIALNIGLFIPAYYGFKKYQEIAVEKGYIC